MEDVVESLARNLRSARHKAGFSQEQLADAAEIDRTYVSGIERGVRNPTIQLVARIANALGTTTSKLLES